MRKYLIVLIIMIFIESCVAQGNIESPGNCSINSTGGNIINSQIYCYPNTSQVEIPHQKKQPASLPNTSEKEDAETDKIQKWSMLGFTNKTYSSLPIYMYPGIPHERDGQISSGLEKALSTKLHFVDEKDAALLFEVTDTNIYYEPPSIWEKPKGRAIFHVDLRWIDGTSLPSVDVDITTEDTGGNMLTDQALQINAIKLGIKQACRQILSMVGDKCP